MVAGVGSSVAAFESNATFKHTRTVRNVVRCKQTGSVNRLQLDAIIEHGCRIDGSSGIESAQIQRKEAGAIREHLAHVRYVIRMQIAGIAN